MENANTQAHAIVEQYAVNPLWCAVAVGSSERSALRLYVTKHQAHFEAGKLLTITTTRQTIFNFHFAAFSFKQRCHATFTGFVAILPYFVGIQIKTHKKIAHVHKTNNY